MDSLVSTEWLAAHLADVVVVDATLLAAELDRDARAEFAAGHIPGAVFLDLASFRDTDSPLPNMLPGPALVAERLAALGLGGGRRIVLTDDSPWHSAARAWVVLRAYGLRDVVILDGGTAKWRAEGRPLERGEAARATGDVAPHRDPAALRSADDVADALATGSAQVVDARSAARFTGAEPDPHAGTAAGHMPGALSLPYGQLFAGDGTWRRGEALAAAFAAAGVDLDRPVIATCGSGVTAAVLLFGLQLLGRDGALYDGSWSEWGADPARPKATGSAR